MRDRSRLHARVRGGVNLPFYWLVRLVLQPFFHVYFRLTWKGRQHVPQEGAAILAANHRSFIDPFVIATLSNRPLYFVAKRELFERRLGGWCLNSLGGFPIDRGNADGDAIETARTLLEQGEAVVIFPEGTRVRPGGVGRAKRGVGQLALATGAPIVPIALTGTDRLRKGWLVRPMRIRLLVGAPVAVQRAEPTAMAAQEVVDRVWPYVETQWEWLGGAARVRRAAILGTGPEADALTSLLPRANVEVTTEPTENTDLIVFAGSAADLPELFDTAEIPKRARVMVAVRGTIGPDALAPVTYAQSRLARHHVAALGHTSPAGEWAPGHGTFTVGCADRTVGAVIKQMLVRARHDAVSVADSSEPLLVSPTPVTPERPVPVAAG